MVVAVNDATSHSTTLPSNTSRSAFRAKPFIEATLQKCPTFVFKHCCFSSERNDRIVKQQQAKELDDLKSQLSEMNDALDTVESNDKQQTSDRSKLLKVCHLRLARYWIYTRKALTVDFLLIYG